MEKLSRVHPRSSSSSSSSSSSPSDLTSDDGKSPPKKPSLDPEMDTIYMPFTSSSSGEAKGIMHNTRSEEM